MVTSNLRTPSVAMGTWAWGDCGDTGNGYFGSNITQSSLQEMVNKAHKSGFNLWDTATVYGMGRSETILGEVLKHFSRSDYQISTKFTPQVAGSGADPLADMLDQSLARLRTDYIDLYWIHNPADVERWTPHLIPLLKSGKVKHVGVSNHNLSEIEFANHILGKAGYRIEAVQNHYSLLYRRYEHAGIMAYCRKQGIPFFAYMVLEQGALSGKYSPGNPLPQGSDRAKVYNDMLTQLTALTDELASIGQMRGAEAADVAIAWAISKGTIPIIGVTAPGYVDGLVRARDITLSTEEIEVLESLADAANVNTRGWWEQAM
ncbi:aldo/keto reductase [Klebsiella variicola]|uniref:aldo/keto reductase n=1 Tax=Klebsiella variicola TaxID=244366 RepID=UPI0015E96B9F|nr:aldo/keto reductase [Klebsiella variicola]QLS59442.1 aldo/keto reductase [Klebsiella variicola]